MTDLLAACRLERARALAFAAAVSVQISAQHLHSRACCSSNLARPARLARGFCFCCLQREICSWSLCVSARSPGGGRNRPVGD